ncbi:hypothetical protein ACB098_12G175000 [Castanea mollissima]
MVVGFDSAEDCALKPLMSLAAKWGKRLLIGCIPNEATVDNVWSHFSQFGHVLDVYLSKDVKKICHRGFGFVTFADDSSPAWVA